MRPGKTKNCLTCQGRHNLLWRVSSTKKLWSIFITTSSYVSGWWTAIYWDLLPLAASLLPQPQDISWNKLLLGFPAEYRPHVTLLKVRFILHCVKSCQLIDIYPLLASPHQLPFSSLLFLLLLPNQSLMYFGLFRVSLPSCCQVREQTQASSHRGKRYYYIILLSLFKSI